VGDPDLGGGESRQRLEADAFLATARREYSVAPPGEPGPPDSPSTSMD
jgi:hypothetical protein